MPALTLLRRSARLTLAAFFLLAPAAFAGGTQHTTPESGEALAKDVETYREHEMFIANPFMEGRAPGTKGNRIAADYIEWTYRQLGLQPAFPSEPDAEGNTTPRASYRQVFKAPPSQRPGDSLKLIEQAAAYKADGDQVDLKPGRDFNVIGYSGNGDVTGDLVFAGYSIMNEDKDYYSYPPKADLSGKIVIVMRFEPMDGEGHSRWSDQKWSLAAALDNKFSEASAVHAAGVILVGPPGADDERTSRLEDMSMGGRRQDFPVVMLSPSAADALVKAADKDHRSLLELRKIADKQGGTIDLPNARVTLKANVEKVELMTDNVGAILPGKGKLADELVIIGSHYDHVGYGYFGSMSNSRGVIHPGADDNASGTSGNLLLAKKLSEAYKDLPEDAQARSVLFLAFSAEESGLIGSHWYANHLIAQVEKHYLMFNMDMIGRLRDGKLEVGGVGTAEGLKDWCQPYLDGSGFKIKASQVGPPNSDHASFYMKKIPDLFYFTGYHPEYHTPKDVVALINFEGAAQVADLVGRMALDAAQRTEPFPFSDGKPSDKEGEKQANAGERQANPHAGGDANNVGSTGLPVRFGIMADYGYDEKPGVLIDHLSNTKGPAEAAGLKAGDLMTKWDNDELKDVQNWMTVMSKHKPGDKVIVTFIRDGKEQKVEATLAPPVGVKQ
jgi:Zn-dependent M28 family amino/carboxypeptidase